MVSTAVRQVLAVSAAFGVVGCGDDANRLEVGGSVPDPSERAVVVSTTPCGDASARTASGVAIDDGRVVTAAHVVVDALAIDVAGGRSAGFPATVEVLDLDSDLAVLRLGDVDPGGSIDEDGSGRVGLTTFDVGDDVELVGGATSGDVALSVERHATIEIESVRGSERVRRDGYVLVGRVADGDSGAGVYAADGRLGAVIFATSDERADTTFAVSAVEIAAVLEREPDQLECDPRLSRLR